jgi:hypothetical protein
MRAQKPEDYRTPTPLIKSPEVRLPTYKKPRDAVRHGKPTHLSKKSEKHKTKPAIDPSK